MQKNKLSHKMWNALAGNGIHTLTPIQQATIPLLLEEKSSMLQAPTGTGKTYAFLLPILEKIAVDNLKMQALIMVPTRELAIQIADVLQKIIADYNPNITYALAIGGGDRNRLIQNLRTKSPHLLIGTPGRLVDILIDEALIDTKALKFVVLDETDTMFEDGFLDAIDAIFAALHNNQICYVVCSATISQAVQQFIKKYIRNIQFIDVPQTADFKSKMEYLFWDVTGKDRLICLQQVMDYYQPYLALVFANTKIEVDEIYQHLTHKGYHIGVLHGNMKTRERAQMLKRIRQLDFQYVICSDIAARGIDIDGVSHIINYELPAEQALEFFYHRAGRTGRSNYRGSVFSLYEKAELPKIQKLIKGGIPFKNVKIVKGALVDGAKQAAADGKKIDRALLQISQKAKAAVNKKQKVKPGYKKKIKKAVENSLQKERKERKKAQIKNNRRG